MVVGATLVLELGGLVDDVEVELVLVDVEVELVLVDVEVELVLVEVVGSVVVVTSVVVVSSPKHPWEMTRFALPLPRSPTNETDAETTCPETTSADQDPNGGPFPFPVIWNGPMPLTVRSASVTVLFPPSVKTQWKPGVSPSSHGSLSP